MRREMKRIPGIESDDVCTSRRFLGFNAIWDLYE